MVQTAPTPAPCPRPHRPAVLSPEPSRRAGVARRMARRATLASIPGAILGLVLAGALGVASARAQPPSEHQYASADDLCHDQTSRQEQTSGVPLHILTAISLVESGRWDERRQARIAWPWTVTSGPDGRFFRTKTEAIAHVRSLQARGVTNIDVGCMQINLRYHGDAFPTLEKAFEPRANVAYAVDFLTRLHADTGSWTRAVSRYHSGTPHLARRYMKKFRVAWREVQDGRAASGAPPMRDILARAAEIEAASQAERARQEAERAQAQAEARAYAESWRRDKLAAYLARRAEVEARRAAAGAS
ncbi:transglycosylase SLT domain-containing protein [Roseospira visakhapatnamensis]|uniref:Transglycosylase SLT domain-containing protein n=1 Tax=Roseospira visakhapatnamensis TaxID=390880 RepID=A0A7W6RCS3_9PROT|nr:transglycosylase SLT domain-containing protein [Roseospira visakhapatnamensis]MBB4266125.1 hypothetical protein [Roseospira visakhapatnamensis]